MKGLNCVVFALALWAAGASGASAAGLRGEWNGAARETSGKTYIFVLKMWSEVEGVVDYKALKCRSLVKAVANEAGKALFREIVMEGAFSGQCDDGFFELKAAKDQLRWEWSAAPGAPPIATGTLTRIGAAP